MSDRYAAFLSYAHRYRPWVQVLQRNLELCLAAAGRPGEVFLDDVDLASGRSWVGQLQAGLDRSEQLVLVATPEALASPRVGDEWQSFLATRRDWQAGHLHIVELVPTPIPPFLESIQRVDFREPGEERYRSGLQDLVAGLLGQTDRRNLPALADGIEVPAPPDPGLPYAQREKLVSWLAPLLSKKVLRLAIAPRLRLQPEALEGQPSWACAASAALVWTTGSEEPVTAAIRIVETLKETFEEDEPGRIPELVSLRDELVNLQREGPERGLLAIWLRQVASDHERLVPYFQRQAEFDLLERVYVQLEMRTETPRKATADLGKGPLDRPAGLREVLSLPRGENPWITGRWVVLGEPGAGKTTLLRHLTATLARDERRPWVPLLESLPRLMRERESLLDRVARRLERSGQPGQGLASALDRAGREGRLLLLFDGLDEVPREDREDAEQLLRDLAVHWPDTPLVVTSRPIGYSRPGSDFRELTLLPLDRARRREFLARWLGRQTGTLDEARADAALGALDAAELRDLAGNPLYLTLMALLFEQGTEPDRNRTRLYDQVFRLLLEGGHRSEGKPLEAREAVHGILRQLAHGMTEENRDAEPVSSIEDRLYRPELDSLRDKIERVSRWRNSLRSFLEDVAERTGILGPHDGPDSDWRFWHRTFREALAAERLEEEYASQPGKVALLERATTIAVEQDLSRWAEPFALLAGRVADPDALVRELVRVNRPLGLRALATAQRLRDETLREVLALSGDWQERREVFLRLPELVAEPRRALALLDLLRQRT
ncbi:MAG TPA: NACHT domain-containing protein, partial [Thermoanaerobaculia bacterium]|nr:NACHT domain-containing protein [Thermoanaerobaculia bacterium]